MRQTIKINIGIGRVIHSYNTVLWWLDAPFYYELLVKAINAQLASENCMSIKFCFFLGVDGVSSWVWGIIDALYILTHVSC